MEQEKISKIHAPLKWAIGILIVGSVFVLVAPFLFTLAARWKWFNFSDTGEIGDTIGGITAPIVNLISAILIYLALKAQVEANLILHTQIAFESQKNRKQDQGSELDRLYSHLSESISHFEFSTFDSGSFGTGQYSKGSEGIYRLFQDFYCDHCHLSDEELAGNPKVTELYSILEVCDSLLTKISQSETPTKDVMRTLTNHQFRYRIYPFLQTVSGSLAKSFCKECNRDHGLPQKMVDLINKLEKVTV